MEYLYKSSHSVSQSEISLLFRTLRRVRLIPRRSLSLNIEIQRNENRQGGPRRRRRRRRISLLSPVSIGTDRHFSQRFKPTPPFLLSRMFLKPSERDPPRPLISPRHGRASNIATSSYSSILTRGWLSILSPREPLSSAAAKWDKRQKLMARQRGRSLHRVLLETNERMYVYVRTKRQMYVYVRTKRRMYVYVRTEEKFTNRRRRRKRYDGI